MYNPIKNLYPLIEMAIKMTGTYEPGINLAYIGEQLTPKQYQLVNGFLQFVHDKGLTFGRANFSKVYGVYIDYLLKSTGAHYSGHAIAN